MNKWSLTALLFPDLADKRKPATKELRQSDPPVSCTSLAESRYQFDGQEVSPEQVAVTPLVGIGQTT